MSAPGQFNPESMDAVVAGMRGDLQRVREDIQLLSESVATVVEKHGKRLTSLEWWRCYVLGGSMVVGVSFGFLAARVLQHVFP